MILPPTEADVRPFLVRCMLKGEIRDVRKLRAAQDDAELVQHRREYLAEAKRRSRAVAGRLGQIKANRRTR